jgi:hypothetical protein
MRYGSLAEPDHAVHVLDVIQEEAMEEGEFPLL